MKKLQKLLKISLMAISLTACARLPEFPEWHLTAIIPSKGTKFTCTIVDKENMKFSCEGEHLPLGAELDGWFCSSPSETKQIINWIVDSRQAFNKKCGKP